MKININPKDIYKNKDDLNYFKSLNNCLKKKILKTEYNISINNKNIPLRFKILNLNISDNNKKNILKQLDYINQIEPTSNDYFKYINYFNIINSIPFNFNNTIQFNNIKQYLLESEKILNNTIYGQLNIKKNIMEFIAKYTTNNNNKGCVLGIQGPPGIGKTTLITQGLSKIFNRPVHTINLSGLSDQSILNGHSFTYEGSKPGKIVDILIKSQCMNPIIYFDELDKVSSKDIENLLINITDFTQNHLFQDNYISDLNIDLSKIIFIFTYNNNNNISPILLDRFTQFYLNGYNINDKINILQKFIIPNLLSEFLLDKDLFFNKNTIEYIINQYDNNSGIRYCKSIFHKIISSIHYAKITNNSKYINLNNFRFPLTINIHIIKKIILNINK